MDRGTEMHLRETAACCMHAIEVGELGKTTRTPEIRPDVLKADDAHERLLALRFDKEVISNAVQQVCSRRQSLIEQYKIEIPSLDYCRFNGRLYCTDFETDEFEAAMEASNGFFDVADIPGWDTWLAHDPTIRESGLLYGWVPNAITDAVGRGMWAIPVESIWWVEAVPDTAK